MSGNYVKSSVTAKLMVQIDYLEAEVAHRQAKGS